MSATAAAAFLAGIIARRRGALIGQLSMLPSRAWWAFLCYIGWFHRSPFSQDPMRQVPLGYRLTFTLLSIVSLPIASWAGSWGGRYGEANGEHYDARRKALLGIR